MARINIPFSEGPSPESPPASPSEAYQGHSPRLTKKGSVVSGIFDSPAFAVRKRGSVMNGTRAGRLHRLGLYQDLTLERTFFFALWIGIQLAIMLATFYQAKPGSESLDRFAKSTTQCLMFDISVIFIFMSPTLLSFLRHTFVSRFVVVDKNVHAHKVASYSAAFWIICHVAVYMYKFSFGAAKAKISLGQYLASSVIGATGLALFIMFILIFTASVPPVRRKFYEVFYYIHHLFVPCVILMFIHNGNKIFYKYVCFPATVYVLDRLFRMVRGYWGTPKIRTVIQHTRDVVELHIEKRLMSPTAGQFVYIMCPSVDPIQWHPFTLTSSPHEDFISVHVSCTGNWTRKFMKRLGGELDGSKMSPPANAIPSHPQRSNSGSSQSSDKTLSCGSTGGGSKLDALMKEEMVNPSTNLVYYMDPVTRKVSARPSEKTDSRVLHQDFNVHDVENGAAGSGNMMPPCQMSKPLPAIFVDGPYGTPTERVFDYNIGVLVGAGIGATPFASVLKYLHHCYENSYRPGKLRKIYFIWVCREFKSLEWFMDLLASLDRTSMNGYLEIRVYLTENVGINKIHNLSLHHNPHGRDAITNLHNCRTHFGRPNFKSILKFIGQKHEGNDIGLFFCGPKNMGRNLRRESQKATKDLKHLEPTKFHFHKENF
ncbi:hypothetical protein H4219_002907 [Mycoemilia scoparia]|uniref:FAD-binding FR-type domain-containing protein n=1 Tax=Mycoemilia scoparia TaxID=417184 RepID=A0A9W8DTS2_9FUNG|nr:hypothetical protein H4219_002907 [Mycoemilia scoparia]